MNKNLIVVLVFIAFFTSCNNGKKPTETSNNDVVKMEAPTFDADSAYAFVDKQVAFGPRVPGTKAHAECADWLENKMKEYTQDVIVQNFKAQVYNGTIFTCKNIITSFNADKKSRILLGAHWDSRPYADHDPNPENHKKPIDGANDGASGVGVLIEVARQLSIKKPELGVDIIFWDIEDYGEPQGTETGKEDTWCLGTQHWAKNPHKQGYSARFGILLDMVGGKNAQFAKEGSSMYYAPDVMNKVWDIANQLGYSSNFTNTLSPSIVDDHIYVNKLARIPMIDIIEYNPNSNSYFNSSWHTLNDNMNGIDKNTLKIVGQVVLATVYNEN